MHSMLGKFSADDILKYLFSYFLQKIKVCHPCKLSPKWTIFMKCQSLFSVENKKTTNNLLNQPREWKRLVFSHDLLLMVHMKCQVLSLLKK